MKKSLTVTGLVAVVWLLLDTGAGASARTLADGPPMLQGGDQVKIVACAIAAGVGLLLVLWSMLPDREPTRVRVRADDRPEDRSSR